MKSLTFAVFVVFAITFSVADDDDDDLPQKFEQARQDCLSQTAVDKKLADDLKNEGVLVNDPKLKEFIFCVNKKVGYQNENGELQPDVIRKVLRRKENEEYVNKILGKCIVSKSTPQETGYEGLKCAFELTESKQ